METYGKKMETVSNGKNSNVTAKANDLGQNIERISQNVGREVSGAITHASEKATKYLDNTRSHIEHNPVQSIALAAVAGIAVGALLTFTYRRKS